MCVCASSCLGCANGKRGNNTLRIGIYISQILLPAGLVAHAYIDMHHANYCTSISKICQYLTRTSPLNCLPSPDYFPVELH